MEKPRSEEDAEGKAPYTHPVPYPNTKDRRDFFEKNTHPVPYPKGEKPYDDTY